VDYRNGRDDDAVNLFITSISASTFIQPLGPRTRFYMEVTGDAIAQLVLEGFERLPRKRKPRRRAELDAAGRREWVPLAGIVVERAYHADIDIP